MILLLLNWLDRIKGNPSISWTGSREISQAVGGNQGIIVTTLSQLAN